MSKITTEDCKQFLLLKFPNLTNKDWKRTRKYKDDNSNWCRDFEHKSGEVTTIIEINNELVLSDTDNNVKKVEKTIKIKDPSKVIYYKSFDSNLLKAAKKIVKKSTDYRIEEEFEITSDMNGYPAIPNCFKFFFTGKGYNSNTKITKDISQQMDFGIFFYPITTDQYDQHLEHIIGDLLPDHLHEECECTFSPYYENEDNALTIKEILEVLSEKGFIYDNKLCDLKEEFKDYTFIPKEAEVIVIDVNLQAELLETLNKDNAIKLEEIIKSGKLDIYTVIKSKNILNYCYLNNKFECFKFLLKNIDDLMKYNVGKKHLMNIILYSLKSVDHIEKYLTEILENGKMDFKNNKYYIDILNLIISKTLNDTKEKSVKMDYLNRSLELLSSHLTDKQYGETIILTVLAYAYAAKEENLLNKALKYIDMYKQSIITEEVSYKLKVGNDEDFLINETILNKLIDLNLKIKDLSIEDFIKEEVKLYERKIKFRNTDFKIIRYGMDGKILEDEDLIEENELEFWRRQLSKIKK